jgi:hypothetical protein
MMSPKLFILLFSISTIACNTPIKKGDVSKENTSLEISTEQIQTSSTKFLPIDSDEALMATALMAAPKESRDSCQVIGYNLQGEFVTFREGSNEFIVLTDDPNKEGFNAACYHKSLETMMARGKELQAAGKSREEIFEIRGMEIKSGELKMGNAGATLHLYYGPNSRYDPESSEVEGARYRYVVYLPYATPESTGLPIQPLASNHPWIMDPGTHRAHIMITPLENEKTN